MNELRVALTPEGYKLWVIRPEVLLLTDELVIDNCDYETIKKRIGRSKLDNQIAIILEILADEGIVEIRDYNELLPSSLRLKIHNLGESIINELTTEQKIKLSEHAYREFRAYLKAKLVHLRPGEPLFNETAKALRATENTLRRIKDVKDGEFKDRSLDSHIKFILGRIVAKWTAGELICQQLDVHGLHDTDEYRPFAKLILD